MFFDKSWDRLPETLRSKTLVSGGPVGMVMVSSEVGQDERVRKGGRFTLLRGHDGPGVVVRSDTGTAGREDQGKRGRGRDGGVGM